MTLTVSDIGGIAVFVLDGAILGGPEATELNDHLHRLVDAGTPRAVIDLTRVHLMNSTGLGMLIGGYTTLRNAGGELRLAGVNDAIRSLLTIAKLHTIFQSYATVDEAVSSLR